MEQDSAEFNAKMENEKEGPLTLWKYDLINGRRGNIYPYFGNKIKTFSSVTRAPPLVRRRAPSGAERRRETVMSSLALIYFR